MSRIYENLDEVLSDAELKSNQELLKEEKPNFNRDSILRNLKNKSEMNHNYLYQTKDMENGINNFTKGNWYNWEREPDYNNLIGKALCLNGKDEILPNKIK